MSSDTQSPRRLSRILVIIVIAIAVVAGIIALVVTQQRGKSDAQPTASSTAAPVKPVPAAEDLNGVEEKLSATVLQGCAALSGDEGWLATGTATNSGAEEQTFLVAVYFLEDGEPVNFAQSRVVVPAGQSVPWVALQKFPSQGLNLSCELVAVS